MKDRKTFKKSIVLFSLTFALGVLIASCNNESCTDGVKNQDETGIDCGGVCPACETCSDGIQNQNETGVDCGGVCNACPTCSDGIQNQGETGIDCGGPCSPCSTPLCSNDQFGATVNGTAYTASYIQTNYQLGNLVISGSNLSTHSINLQVDTAWVAGSYNISGSFGTSTTAGGQYSYLPGGPDLYEATTGTLVILENDKTGGAMSATFSFDGNLISGGGSGTASVTNGSFCVSY
ncbi:MAG: hypothetical protein HUJ25_05640 [Crocinitomicaceae bacterium]|nr:hypothetical protein [Crocinitomicaceae bacterium]